MEHFYLVIIIILFVLAVSDLVVGVSNDAVNFLNSAIGSKVAPFRIILIIASLGVLFGATFSNGMMEVARNGIMNPSSFTFNDILIIFLAVMITDVLLLDLFNTFGLPTSTTVSVVFELLGASVGMAIVKISHSPEGAEGLAHYINSGKTLAIITGILLSVGISFIVGVVVQYIARVIFSFNYKKSVRYFGSLWGGLAITGITYFILIKGAKGSSFIDKEQLAWIAENSALILGVCFVGWTVLLQLLYWLFRVNVLRVIVLFGTFALAMAFAGNDLVNFIGVPMAGYESFLDFSTQNNLSGTEFTMTSLMESVKTPTGFLLIAGIIMVLALWLSKKARTVTQTELSLGNQDLTNERFASSALSRSIVRIGVSIGKALWTLVPGRLKTFLESRFDDSSFKKKAKKEKDLSFDLIRASVNLAVASSLIAFATSYKLPLSTTYVTFMVAMSTSLADKAWGRESAVYRISGVITVIGGWFFTAFVAFSGALIMALLMSWAGPVAVVVLIAIAIFAIYRTHSLHKKKTEEIRISARDFWNDETITGSQVLAKYNDRISVSMMAVADLFETSIEALLGEKRKKLAKSEKEIRKLTKEIKTYKKNAHQMVSRLGVSDLSDDGEYYFQILDHMSEVVHYLDNIIEQSFNHVDNNHEPIPKADDENLHDFMKDAVKVLKKARTSVASGKFESLEDGAEIQRKLSDELSKMRKSHLKRFKSGHIQTGVSLLYLDILAESRNMLLSVSALLKTASTFTASHSALK